MNLRRFSSFAVGCVLTVVASGCAQPPLSMPDASVIEFDGHVAMPPDCSSLARPSVLTDGGWHRPQMEWGCATYTDLAAQLANPKDIESPGKLGPADAAVAASAVHRYKTGRVTPLDQTSTQSEQH